MAARYSFTFLLLALCSCFSSRSQDERFYVENKLYVIGTPNAELLEDAFVSWSDPIHDTLIFSAGREYTGLLTGSDLRIFVLLTRDSSDKPLVIHGTWDYWQAEYGDSTGHVTLHPFEQKSRWSCRVYLQDSTKSLKNLEITDFFEEKEVGYDPFKVHFHDEPTKYQPPTTLRNSRGHPFDFKRVIFLQN